MLLMPVVGEVKGAYDPHKVEEEVKSFWERNKVYQLVKSWRKGRPYFNFLDGPPYPSSDVPHAGTAWNKVLKDAILRYKRMAGYDVNDRPGYDCHGLPVEVAVEKKLGIRVKREIEEKIGVEKFIEECKKFVSENIQGLTKWFKELGVFMDWDDPYLTMRDDYIEAGWWLVKKAYEKGLLDLDYRVVYWCPRCSTTLAEYEVEYREIEDPSIYVKFPVKSGRNEYLLIWTTTPWTLVANTFVMVHPDALYVKVRVGDDILILARPRLEHVMREAGVSEYEVIEEVPGKELVGLTYTHPLEDVVPVQKKLSKHHRVVAAPEYVTLYEGTGLVHAAPGHGFEDFNVARREGIKDIASPVDDEGRFTKDAGPYAGLPVREASKRIIEDLKTKGALFYAGRIRHRYPVCWRCKTPVILRATRQWVLRVSRLKEKLIEEARKAEWIPSWALRRLLNLLENVQDWVISRQRFWGIPLPIWRCAKCGYTVVIGSREELQRYGGSVPNELHRPWVDRVVLRCPKCGGPMYRVSDVMDVWFDSGIAFYASRRKSEDYKVDLIVEGHDQTRGWFFSLLRTGVIGFESVPYRTVLVHGFMLDEKGREMHKSLGNYVGTDDIVRRAGRDPFRLWVLQNTVWEDARFSWRALDEARSDLSIAWNVFVFASTYMRLDGFDPTRHRLEDVKDHLKFEDLWLLSRLNRLVKHVTELMEGYRVHEALRLVRSFIVEDVSRWYVRLIRRRVWVEENTPDKIAAYVTLYTALKTWLALAAPFIPFIAEKLYQDFVKPAEPDLPLTVHMLDWPKPVEEYINDKVEKEMDIVKSIYEASAAARMKAGIKLRQPLRKLVVYTDRNEVAKTVERRKDLVRMLTNVHEVEVKGYSDVAEAVEYEVEVVYSKLGPRYRRLAKKLFEEIKKNQDKIAREILKHGKTVVTVEGEEAVIEKDDVIVKPRFRHGMVGWETEWGYVVLDTRLGDKEIAEGIARDLVRRIQFMRKELNLRVDEYIDVVVYVPQDHKQYVNSMLDYIKGEVRARSIRVVDDPKKVEGARVRDWIIGGADYRIGISRSAG